jgi:hypothetical protein
MAWEDTKSHFFISIVLLVLDFLLATVCVLLIGLQSSALNCSGDPGQASIWLFVIPVVLVGPPICAVFALIKKRHRLFSRIAFYSFLFLLVAAPISLASKGNSRCIPSDVYAVSTMRWLKTSLDQYRADNGSYPESLEAVFPPTADKLFIRSHIQYNRIDSSYLLCAKVKRSYFYGIQYNSGSKICTDPNTSQIR